MPRHSLKSLSRRTAPFLAAGLGMAGFLAAMPAPAQEGIAIPAPAVTAAADASATAVFAGGCFWGVQGVFQHVEGVTNAVSGYAGGAAEDAHYKRVGSGETGHAEAVRVTYDPGKVSYGKLMQVFFSAAHDPTEVGHQGPDWGSQYRTAIFPQDAAQAEAAKSYIATLDGAKLFRQPIATTIEPGHTFYPAEDYHQDYLTLHPDQPYIVYNDLPKIENLKRLFPKLYRDDPTLVSEAASSN
ncbi:MAG: peptide-methionine (S)-S-oxide reductase MsrA [Rhizobiaceae bacterium]